MDLIEKAREFGDLIQKDERYLNYQKAAKESEDNKELQDKIGKFNLKRLNINQETMKKEKDPEKIKQLDKELNALYKDIMANELMVNYNKASEELNKLVSNICTIITKSSEGENPQDIDLNACSGNCASCGGCH